MGAVRRSVGTDVRKRPSGKYLSHTGMHPFPERELNSEYPPHCITLPPYQPSFIPHGWDGCLITHPCMAIIIPQLAPPNMHAWTHVWSGPHRPCHARRPSHTHNDRPRSPRGSPGEAAVQRRCHSGTEVRSVRPPPPPGRPRGVRRPSVWGPRSRSGERSGLRRRAGRRLLRTPDGGGGSVEVNGVWSGLKSNWHNTDKCGFSKSIVR